MASIIARITRTPDESILAFKQRVSDEYGKLCEEHYPKCPERDGWVLARRTVKQNVILNDPFWGAAFPELPDETCCIVWLNRGRATHEVHLDTGMRF